MGANRARVSPPWGRARSLTHPSAKGHLKPPKLVAHQPPSLEPSLSVVLLVSGDGLLLFAHPPFHCVHSRPAAF